MPAKKKTQPPEPGSGAQRKLPPGVKLLRTLQGHQGAVMSVAFDPQGSALASGSGDRTVKLWEARSGKLLRTLEGHQNSVVKGVRAHLVIRTPRERAPRDRMIAQMTP